MEGSVLKTIAKAIIKYTNGRLPTEHELSQARGGFWTGVAGCADPDKSWTKSQKKRGLQMYYKHVKNKVAIETSLDESLKEIEYLKHDHSCVNKGSPPCDEKPLEPPNAHSLLNVSSAVQDDMEVKSTNISEISVELESTLTSIKTNNLSQPSMDVSRDCEDASFPLKENISLEDVTREGKVLEEHVTTDTSCSANEIPNYDESIHTLVVCPGTEEVNIRDELQSLAWNKMSCPRVVAYMSSYGDVVSRMEVLSPRSNIDFLFPRWDLTSVCGNANVDLTDEEIDRQRPEIDRQVVLMKMSIIEMYGTGEIPVEKMTDDDYRRACLHNKVTPSQDRSFLSQSLASDFEPEDNVEGQSFAKRKSTPSDLPADMPLLKRFAGNDMRNSDSATEFEHTNDISDIETDIEINEGSETSDGEETIPVRVPTPVDLKRDFSFQISLKDWNEWRPDHSHKLKTGWTDEFDKRVAKAGNKYCVLAFKPGRVSSPGKGYRTAPLYRTHAQCTHSFQGQKCLKINFCINKTAGTVLKDPLTVNVTSVGKFNHTRGEKRRRHFRRPTRLQLRRALKLEQCHPNKLKVKLLKDQREKDASVLSAGNFNGCPSKKIIEKIASEENVEKYLDTDVYVDLEKQTELIMENRRRKHALEGKEYTHDIFPVLGKKPFICIWQSQEQIAFVKALRGKKKKKKELLVLHGDATGGTVCSLPWTDEKVLYYAICVQGKTGKSPIPIAECLSGRHKVRNLTYWLDHGIQGIQFDVFLTDCSWALTHAVLKSGLDTNIVNYLNKAYDDVMRGEPISYAIFMWCSAHVVHTVARHIPQKKNESYEERFPRKLALFMFAECQRTSDIYVARDIIHDFAIIFDTPEGEPNVDDLVKKWTYRLAEAPESDDEDEEGVDDPGVPDSELEHGNKDEDEEEIKKKDKEFMTEAKDVRDGSPLYRKSKFFHFFMEKIPDTVFSRHRKQGKEQPKSGEDLRTKKNGNRCYKNRLTMYMMKYIFPYWVLWSIGLLKLLDGNVLKPFSNWPNENHFENVKRRPAKLHERPSQFVKRMVDGVEELLVEDEFDPDFARVVKQRPKKEDVNTCEEIWRPHKNKQKGAAYSKSRAAKFFADRISKKYKKMPTPQKPQLKTSTPISKTPKSGNDLTNKETQYTSCLLERNNDSTKVDTQSQQTVARKLSFETENTKEHDKKSLNIEGSSVEGMKGQTPEPLPEKGEEKGVTVDGTDKNIDRELSVRAPWDDAVFPECLFDADDESMLSLPDGSPLTVEEARTVLPGGWIGGEMINAFMQTRASVAQKKVRILTFDSYFLTSLLEKKTGFLAFGEKVNCLSYDIWLCPFNARRNHWSLVAVILKSKLIIHIDSKTNGKWHDDLMLSLLLSFIQRMHMRKFQRPEDMNEWSIYRPSDIPDQVNGNDCGVHVCYWAHIICTGDGPEISEEMCQRVRPWILNEVLTIPPPEREICATDKDAKIELINSMRRKITISEGAPEASKTAFEYCKGLVSFLYREADSACALMEGCKQPQSKMYKCALCREMYHVECVNDVPPSRNCTEYRCPTCKSSKQKKVRSRLQLKKKQI